MKVVVQRSKYSKVEVDGKLVNAINSGLVLLVGFTQTDTEKEIVTMARKIANLRIFDDENGIMNKSLLDISGSILSISQFTLYADTTRGRRPSYVKALNGNEASVLYNIFNSKLKDKNIKLATGIFGAEMEVNIVNDGPITILLEKENLDERK